jgi:hypothetical protein
VDMQKTGCRQREVAQRSDGVSGDLRALAGLAGSCPGAAVCLNSWSHEALRDEFNCCLGARVTEVVQGLEHLPSQRCWDVPSRFSGRHVAVELDGGAGD